MNLSKRLLAISELVSDEGNIVDVAVGEKDRVAFNVERVEGRLSGYRVIERKECINAHFFF